MGRRRQLLRSGITPQLVRTHLKGCVPRLYDAALILPVLSHPCAPRSLVHLGANMILSKVYILP